MTTPDINKAIMNKAVMNNRSLLAAILLLLIACGGGGGSGSGGERDRSDVEAGSSLADFDCDGACEHQSLAASEVVAIIENGVREARRLGVNATFAVLDRVGNVLAVYQMNGALASTTINGQIGARGGLDGGAVPAELAAISKAGTGVYLSSQGNAFSSRTASQIVQEHFNPGEHNQPGGPLFGVQFSQLLCSDVTTVNPQLLGAVRSGAKALSTLGAGPRPLPLGLAADPGGLPLYKNGDLVGGVGVEFDGSYTIDRNIRDQDNNSEERVALFATLGFEAPSERIAPNINVAGRSLRYSDLTYADLATSSSTLATESVDLTALGTYRATPFYSDGTVKAGVTYGTATSGILASSRVGIAAEVLVNQAGVARFPTRAGRALSAVEVDALLDSALLTAHRARAAIRRPLSTAARVSVWVVDTDGVPLGFARSQDAPVFGIDVALQKPRTAVFFSSVDAAEKIATAQARNGFGAFDDYLTPSQAMLGVAAFADGAAFAARSIGNLSRPFFVDGIDGNPNGPLSLPFPGNETLRSWSPFNTGLQLDLIFQRLVAPIGIPVFPQQLPDSCSDRAVFGSRLANGIQIFPGAVPLYKGDSLVGAIGVSGDGIDQDDLVAFYGASRPGLDASGHADLGDPTLGFNAPYPKRADQLALSVGDARLRYVNCPEAPFRDNDDQNVCAGL